MKKEELIILLSDVNISRFEKILQSYVKPHFNGREKFYHSYDHHILRMKKDLLEKFSNIILTEYEVLILLAVIYFHDIVYNVSSQTNEEDSVEEFCEFLICNKQLSQFITDENKNLNDFKNEISEIILSTKIRYKITDNSTELIKIIHDLDYASFADFERFEEDAEFLKRESKLDNNEFAFRRREFLKNLVDKQIYFTDEYKKFNELAQINIKKVLNSIFDVDKIIEKLNLQPLTIEGGFFNEIFRSTVQVKDMNRSCGTSIYYLLEKNQVSSWHKVASDEIWYYHAGVSAAQLLIFPDGRFEKRIIGGNVLAGEVPQSFIPAGTWQAAVLISTDSTDYGLFGAAVFPSFEYEDFEGATVSEICKLYPQHKNEIIELFN